jgi:hypothetical protein
MIIKIMHTTSNRPAMPARFLPTHKSPAHKKAGWHVGRLCPLGNMLKEPPHKQHIWFLPTQKPTLEKPKELFFANARQERN